MLEWRPTSWSEAKALSSSRCSFLVRTKNDACRDLLLTGTEGVNIFGANVVTVRLQSAAFEQEETDDS